MVLLFVHGSDEQQPRKYGSFGHAYQVPPLGQVKWHEAEPEVQLEDILN